MTVFLKRVWWHFFVVFLTKKKEGNVNTKIVAPLCPAISMKADSLVYTVNGNKTGLAFFILVG